MAVENKIISFWKQVKLRSSDMFTKFKVGIGVKVPTHKLHVKDTKDPIRIEGVQSDTSSSTKFLVLDGSNVIKHSEGSGKTTEQVQDIVGAMFTGNTETNITATYEDSDGTIDLVATNTQLTNEQVQDIVGAMFTSNTETRISATYEDSDGTIDLVVDDMTADTNTNLGNTNLTSSGARTYDIDGNTLDFQTSGNSIFKIEEDNVAFGTSQGITEVNFRFGTNAPAIQIYEASGSGTNYIKLTCGALGANRTLTMPDATGTIALTSDISNTNLANTNLTADGDRTFNINANTIKFQNNVTTYLQLEDGAMILGGGGDEVSFRRDSGSASARVKFYEPPTDGSSYAQITTPALSGNIILTLPTSTGTLALTSDIAANTNIANTNLTATGDRTLDMDGNDLAFDKAQNFVIGSTTPSSEFEVNATSVYFKSGNQAPDFRIYEDSDSGTNYVKITCGALSANRTLTMPNATGTIALTSDLDHDALTNFVAAEHYRWDTDISATATINAANIPTLNQSTTGNAATATALATARAINGVNFDGTAPITITAAGSTLSDTVPVSKGGTGATTLTSNAVLTGNGTSAIQAESDLTFSSGILTLTDSNISKPSIQIKSTGGVAHIGGSLDFITDEGDAGASGDILGKIRFIGDNADQDIPQQTYANIQGKVDVATDGEESGILELQVANHDDDLGTGLTLTGGSANNEIDVTIGLGSSSLTTISGDLQVSGNDIKDDDGTTCITFDSSGNTTIAGTTSGTFSGNLTGDASGSSGSCTGQAATVATIAGLAPNTATTAAAQPNITSLHSSIAITKQVKVTLSTANCNALHTTPRELVAAQGANTVIVPTGGMIRVDRASTQSNSAADLNMHYADQEPGTAGQTSVCHYRRFMYNEGGDRVYHIVPGLYYQEVSQNLTDDVNKALEISVDSAFTTNCFTSIDIYLTYNVFDIS